MNTSTASTKTTRATTNNVAGYRTSQVALYQLPSHNTSTTSTASLRSTKTLTADLTSHTWSLQQTPNYSKSLNALKTRVESIKKWRYLLSDSLTFSDQTHAIRIQKPPQSMVMDYCKKLLCAAQLKELFIENHEFTVAQKEELVELAKNNNVSVILLNVEQGYHRNVISGPWLQ